MNSIENKKTSKNVERIFEKNGKIDQKHKLNTCSKLVPSEVLDKIEVGGVTSEQLDTLCQKFDVYKYRTQITIHGKFDELQVNRIGSYCNLIQNKNKSIGVKWSAIDHDKKRKIYSLLSECGFKEYQNSSNWSSMIVKRFDNKTDAINCCVEFQKEINKVDANLFYGSYFVNTWEYMGMYYSEKVLVINGIYEANIPTLISQLTNKTAAQIELQIKQRYKDEDKKEAERKALRDIKDKNETREKTEYKQNNPLQGFKTKQTDLTNIIIAIVTKKHTGEIGYKFKTYKKSFGKINQYSCDINGITNSKGMQSYDKQGVYYCKTI